MARRFMVAVLPWFALERERGGGGLCAAVAVVRLVRSRRVVVVASPAAWRAGVRVGMTATEATAVLPGLAVVPEDAEAEAAAWRRLARLGYEIAPLAGSLGPLPERGVADPFAQPALWVEVTGTQRLYGSEEAAARRQRRDLAAQGYTAFVAVADTPAAARAVAAVHAVKQQQQQQQHTADADAVVVVPPGQLHEALRDLPLGALALPGPLLTTLAGLALDTLGELVRIPRPTLAARFGDELPAVLAETLGEVPVPLLPEPLDTRLRVVAPLEGPTDRRDSVLFCFKRMCDALHERLRRDAQGARVLSLKLERASAGCEPLRAEVHLSVARRRAAALFELVRAQVERFDFSQPVDELELAVPRREPLPSESAMLFSEDDGDSDTAGPARTVTPEALGALIDRLREHLGPMAVTQWRLRESYVPEAAYEVAADSAAAMPQLEAMLSRSRHRRHGKDRKRKRQRKAPPQGTPAPPPAAPRPTLLLEPPVLVHLRDLGGQLHFDFATQRYEVTRRVGPERLVTAWWTGTPTSRDYQQLHTRQGPIFWGYRGNLPSEFWLHGVFD